MNIYVGNLPYDITEAALQEMFAQYGEVQSVSIITDRETGRSRGFGFVEMPNDEQARQAIEALNEKEHDGRNLKVSEARPRQSKPRPGGGEGGYRSSRNSPE